MLGENSSVKGVYCVANAESMPLKNYIEIIHKKFQKNLKCIFDDKRKSVEGTELRVDISKLQRDIGFVHNIIFEQAIDELIRFRADKQE